MGAECSSERNNTNLEENQDKKELPENEISNINSFNFKTYKEYYYRMDLLKAKIKEIIKEVEITNDFKVKKE
jgi:hypothetical protein